MKKQIKKIKKLVWKFPIFIILFSIIGLAASMMISIEKTHLLINPEAELSCTINPIYSCQSVILSNQASIFGFSNELIGIAFFGGMLALGLGMLANAKYNRWLHQLAWAGLLASMGVVIWFFYQSVYNINALCIYCSIVWFSTWTLFVGYTNWLITSSTINIPKKYKGLASYFVQYSQLIWLALIFVFAGLVLHHFWYFYGQYFS
jgi:uncharacterized membrane protein